MERDLFQILQERGFVEWCSDPDELSRVLGPDLPLDI